MTVVIMLDPSVTVGLVKLTLCLTGSHIFFCFFSGVFSPRRDKNEKNVWLPVKLSVSLTGLTVTLGSSVTTKVTLDSSVTSRSHAKHPTVCP